VHESANVSLAVEHGAHRKPGQRDVDAREAPVVAAPMAGEQARPVLGDVGDGADAVPLGLEHPLFALRQLAAR
jgi:hypothetical protein